MVWDTSLLTDSRGRRATPAAPPLPPQPPPLCQNLAPSLPRCSRSLMCHLREGENLEAELRDTLRPEELRALLASTHRPNYTCQVRPPACLASACCTSAPLDASWRRSVSRRRSSSPPSPPRLPRRPVTHSLTRSLTPPLALPPAPSHRTARHCTALPQVLTAVIKAAQLGDNYDSRDSGANVKASAAFRMDENLTVFAVSGGLSGCVFCDVGWGVGEPHSVCGVWGVCVLRGGVGGWEGRFNASAACLHG